MIPSASTKSPESIARTILLAQALESCDPRCDLVSLEERNAATLAALQHPLDISADAAAADDQLVAARSGHLAGLLASRFPALGSLQHPSALLSWLGVALPVLALVAGVFTDRIANPHRVDLLSAPLLLIIGFNLLVYGALAILAMLAIRRNPSASASLIPLLQKIDAWLSRQSGTRARVAAGFYQLWHAAASHLLMYRWKAVMHLSAAAWGAGIAVSIAGRGLFVQYKVGWESTFLTAETVHSLLGIIFWLPTTLFNLTPLTLAEVAAMRNFQTDGVAGDRWVWMYVGLTTLLVVLPRLMLAAWAAYRARGASRQLRIDMGTPYVQGVLASMRRTRLKIGIAIADERTRDQLLRLIRVVADDPLAQRLTISTPEGDVLQWVEDTGDGVLVDCFLSIGPHGDAERHSRPSVFVPDYRFAKEWAQWSLLTEALAARLDSPSQAGWLRLGNRLEQTQRLRFEQSMSAVAACLSKVVLLIHSETSSEGPNVAMDELFLALQQLHRLDRTTGRALELKLVKRYSPKALMGKTSVAAASAATGAGMGAAVDAATGFITLGAGTALGALLGAGIGWMGAVWRKKGAVADTMQHITQAALLLYMEFSNAVRVHPETGDSRHAWAREIETQVQQRQASLSAIWSREADAPTADRVAEAVPVLMEAMEAVIARLYKPDDPVEIVGDFSEF